MFCRKILEADYYIIDLINIFMNTFAPFARPLYVMLKPIGAHCNLACDYCYYLEKAKLYDNIPKHVMSEEMLESFTREYIQSQTMPRPIVTGNQIGRAHV